MTYLKKITIFSINELEGVEGGGIAPESTKVCAKSSDEGKTAVVPSEGTRGGKEKEAKLELTFLKNARKRLMKTNQRNCCIF